VRRCSVCRAEALGLSFGRLAHALHLQVRMREKTERQRTATNQHPDPDADGGRERKAVDARYEAHRRWIGDEEDACRGID